MRAQAPVWADAVGQDAAGTYAEFVVAGVAQRMRYLPPGRFEMGSPETEAGRFRGEGPQRLVTLTRGLWLGAVPVTQALWEAVMGTSPSAFAGAERPVERVSWGDAQAFVRRVNDLVRGLDLRLPREAEWEYACRAGSAGPTWLAAHNARSLDRVAWFEKNSAGQTQPVGLKAPNPFGLQDMLGNVWEWCEDRYAPYDVAPVVDPPPPASGTDRVIRGGCWGSRTRGLRAAMRQRIAQDSRDPSLGFRVAASDG